MNREEATSLLRKVIQACEGLGVEGFMLTSPNAEDALSHGYQVHIKGKISLEKLTCLKPLADEYKLAIANEPEKNLIIIYRPSPNISKLAESQIVN